MTIAGVASGDPMRIALFTDTFRPDVNGVARTLGRLVTHGSARGHEFALVTPRVGGCDPGPTTLHHRLPGIALPLYPDLSLARPLDRAGKALLERFDPDLVHVATESTVGWSGRRWALRRGTPLVTSFHTDFPAYAAEYGLGFARRVIWRYLRSFHARARATFCPSGPTRRQLLRHGFRGSVHIWPRGVDHQRFGPHHRTESMRRTLAPGAERIIMYVGRIAAEKRIEVLLEAFRGMRGRATVPTHLVLVGDGPLLPRIRGQGWSDVHCTGFLTGAPLAEAYAAGDLFAFPSDTETFGNVVLEALASGLPVVAADRGGFTDVIRHGENGLLFPRGDPGAMADACLALLGDDGRRRRFGHAARATAETLDWGRILDRVLDSYREVLREACTERELATP